MLEQNNEKKEAFTYTYSAKQQEDINTIKQKYIPKEENKMEELRRLDHNVVKKGNIASITVGTIGAMILGLGLSCTMVWGGALYVPGIIFGLLGIGFIAVAYPLYVSIIKKERAKIAPKILKLIEDLEK